MATLVLSTVGTALGGPVGGAIGALIGQSIDQQLLAPPTRGPRLGDLSVQSSSYGTQIPRIYGSMRVAGSVVWATDLVESQQTTGAKGQPDVTYSYSVSLAVALSSRPVGAVGRIWADGKLLRGAEGDFKVPTTFRFYDGSEDQPIDSLIGSIEGPANTPAYRGVALAVFENLELAAFGNRIPFMTFEVIADAAPPAIASILSDASDGFIAGDAPATVVGYAAYGRSIASALQPLVECFDVRLFDDGSLVRGPSADPITPIAADELGNSDDGQPAARIQRQQSPVIDLPSTLRLTYYDPDRDYQSGEARAVAGDDGNVEMQLELPAVVSAGDAKNLVQQMLARQWAQRDKLVLRLPPQRISLEPGTVLSPGLEPSGWVVEKSTIDRFVSVLELRPSWNPTSALAADPGRVAANDDVAASPMSLALIDAPATGGDQSGGAAILVAASSPDRGWHIRPLAVTGAGQSFATVTASAKSVLGRAVSALGAADPHLIDEVNSVEVELVDTDQWLTSCDDDALADGTNLAMIGDEVVQFGSAMPLGQGLFRLERLLRGRGGTEWATGEHAAGEIFCLLDGNSLRSVTIPAWMRGVELVVADRDGATGTIVFGAEAARPITPGDLTAVIDVDSNLAISWTRRSRVGFAWLDEVDAPVGESREQYSVAISSAAGSLEYIADQPALTVTAGDLPTLGPGPASIEVRQLGDLAASRPAQLTIQLP